MSESKDITNVGLDVHKSGINVAVILPSSKTVEEEWQPTNETRARAHDS